MLERRPDAGDERGFTLTELMVVVLIIGILIAIALPTFLGARTRAQNRAAQSDLRNALIAAKTLYTDENSYSTVTTAALSAAESSETFTSSAVTTPGPVMVLTSGTAPDVAFSAARLSSSGYCYYISDSADATTTYGKSAAGDQASCTASTADATDAGWT